MVLRSGLSVPQAWKGIISKDSKAGRKLLEEGLVW